MKTPTFNFVFIPDFGDQGLPTSVFLAETLSHMNSPYTGYTQIFDFGLEYESFCSKQSFSDDEKNIAFFVDLFWNKIFKPGFMTFVVNFDFEDFWHILEQFSVKKSNGEALLLFTHTQADGFYLKNHPWDIDSCIHDGVPNKTVMQKLGITGESH